MHVFYTTQQEAQLRAQWEQEFQTLQVTGTSAPIASEEIKKEAKEEICADAKLIAARDLKKCSNEVNNAHAMILDIICGQDQDAEYHVNLTVPLKVLNISAGAKFHVNQYQRCKDLLDSKHRASVSSCKADKTSLILAACKS